MKRIGGLTFAVFAAFNVGLGAVPDHNWQYSQSTHFVICWNESTAGLAAEAASICESVLAKIGPVFFPNAAESLVARRMCVVLSDDSDFPNGFAMSDDRLIQIYCRKGRIGWRGDSDWLRTVLSHELSHAFTFMNKRMVFRLGVSGSAEFVDRGFSIFPGWFLHEGEPPPWFIEGLAQYGSERFGADGRDPYREMLLRDAFLYGRLLPLASMWRFEGTSRDNELIYNEGFDLVRYLAHSGVNITGLCPSSYIAGLGPALKKISGRSLASTFKSWTAGLETRFGSAVVEPGQGFVFPARRADFVEETAVRENARFCVANWGSDYTFPSLFVRSKNGTERIPETGPGLARDRKNGDVYYSKLRYSFKFGMAVFDVRRYHPSGSDPWVTHDARCLAFDAYDGVLYYAAYASGKTTVYRKSPGVAAVELKVFDRAWSVDSITVIEADRLCLSLGGPAGRQAAILDSTGLTFLWPDVKADVQDVYASDADTLYFASTLDGSSQIYLASLSAPGNWYRVTHVTGGAFAPVCETIEGKQVLFYSVYRDGSFKMVKNTDLMAGISGVIPVAAATQAAPTPARTPSPVSLQKVDPPVLLFPPSVGVTFGYAEFLDYHTNHAYARSIGADYSVSLFTPSQSFGLDFTGGISIPIEAHDYYNLVDGNLGVSMTWDLLGGELTGIFNSRWNHSDFSYEGTNFGGYLVTGNAVITSLQGWAQLGFDISHHGRGFLTFEYRGDDLKQVMDIVFNDGYSDASELKLKKIYALSSLGAFWGWGRNVQLRQVYAGVGAGQDQFWIEGRSRTVSYNKSYWSTNGALLDKRTVYLADFGASCRRLFFWNRLSVKLMFDGFAWIGGSTSDRSAPFTYGGLGGEDFFSGYPSGYFSAKIATRALLELNATPFLRGSRATRWYHELGLGVKLEAGAAMYYLKRQKPVYPASLELSLRQGFHLVKTDPGLFFVKFAIPLFRLAPEPDPDPWQVYIGFTVNYSPSRTGNRGELPRPAANWRPGIRS